MSPQRKNTQKTKNGGRGARILVSAVGIIMILLGVSRLFLFFAGDKTTAQVVTRRVGGASDQYSLDKRYEWSIDYTFRDKEGKTHSGHTTRRGGDMGVKVEKTVYYLAAAPVINGLATEVEPNLGQPVLVGLGILLVIVMNRRPRKTNNRFAMTPGKPVQAQPPVLTDYDDSIEEVYHEVAPGYCTACGAPRPENGRFCTNCGKPIAS